MKKNCPCTNCVTKAMCIGKPWELILDCKLIRDYILIDEKGPSYDIDKLQEFCDTMGLKLMQSKPRFASEGHAFFIK